MQKSACALFLIASLTSCNESPIDRCIAAQMDAWEAETERYQADNPNSTAPLVIAGIQIGPPSEEQARAAANLKCGKAYRN